MLRQLIILIDQYFLNSSKNLEKEIESNYLPCKKMMSFALCFFRLYLLRLSVMRKSSDKNIGTPVKQFMSTKKNFLADRLFDRPNMRTMSTDQRPKIFSNGSQEKKLTPSITKAYQKKISTHESLPPI